MGKIPRRKKGSDRTTDASPFHHLSFALPRLGTATKNMPGPRGRAAWVVSGAPSGHRRAGKSSSPLEHPSRPGRASAPETAPIGWDCRRAWETWVFDISPRRYSQLLQDDESVGALQWTKVTWVLLVPSHVCYGWCGVLGIVVIDVRREASRFRTASAVFPLSARHSRRGRRQRGGDCETWIRRGSRPSRSTRREHGFGARVDDDLGPQRTVFCCCSCRVGVPRRA